MTDNTTDPTSLLQKTALFRDMTDAEVKSMIPHFKQITLQAGDVLIEENTVGHNMYIILEGQLEVVMQSGDIITAVNDKKTVNISDFYRFIADGSVKEVWFDVLREGQSVSTMRYKK